MLRAPLIQRYGLRYVYCRHAITPMPTLMTLHDSCHCYYAAMPHIITIYAELFTHIDYAERHC